MGDIKNKVISLITTMTAHSSKTMTITHIGEDLPLPLPTNSMYSKSLKRQFFIK